MDLSDSYLHRSTFRENLALAFIIIIIIIIIIPV
jgi:hypothetical protein